MYRDRRWTADEVRAIVARAAQQRGAEVDAPPRTLEEIEALGEQLGVSREAIRAAASGAREGPPALRPRTFGERLRGGPSVIRHDLVVPGRIDSSKHEALVDILRANLGAAGRAEVLGETLTWTFGGQNARFVTVTFKPAEGGTRIRFEESLSPLAGGLYGGLVGGVGGGLGGGLSPLLPLVLHWPPITIPLVIALAIGVAYAIARTVFAAAARKRVASAAAIVDALAAELGAASVRVPNVRVADEREALRDDDEPAADSATGRRSGA